MRSDFERLRDGIAMAIFGLKGSALGGSEISVRDELAYVRLALERLVKKADDFLRSNQEVYKDICCEATRLYHDYPNWRPSLHALSE